MRPEMTRTMSLAEALRTLLRQQLDVVVQNLADSCEGLEREGLHDLRVAVRRTRSLVARFEQVLPETFAVDFLTELTWLGEITGPTRDLDVFLAKIEGFRAGQPRHIQADLKPFLVFLGRQRRLEQKHLRRRLSSLRVRKLIGGWQHGLEDAALWEMARMQTRCAVKDVASEHIRKAFRQFIRRGHAMTSASPDEEFHKLRIRGKRLRYLLEFFACLYPEEEVTRLVKKMKAMQDVLGDYHDLVVQQATLREFNERMSQDSPTPPATLLAMGVLLGELQRRQDKVRSSFPKQFRSLDKLYRTSFTQLCKP
jgi:CHAD domain-containing protein